MAKANTDIRMALLLHDVYAYEVAEELGICITTYSVRMRKEMPAVEKDKFLKAIIAVAARKAKLK